MSLMIYFKLKGSLINLHLIYNVICILIWTRLFQVAHVYWWVHSKLGSSSTASMHQPPNQDKVPCLRLESSTRDITLLSKTWLMYKTIEPCSPHIFLTRFWHICPDQATPVGTVISGSVTFPITTWIMWLISMGRRLCRTCVLLCNLQFNHCFSKMTSVLTGMHGTRPGR